MLTHSAAEIRYIIGDRLVSGIRVVLFGRPYAKVILYGFMTNSATRGLRTYRRCESRKTVGLLVAH